MKKIGILGSTGSIGRSCLAVIEAHPDRFQVASLTAGENVALLAEQVRAFHPSLVSMGSEAAANALCRELKAGGTGPIPEITVGREGMRQAATLPEIDVVLSSTVGVAGLPATFAALEAGKQVALANKEVLVAAGELATELAHRKGTELLPVDSEHNGVHQCLRAGHRAEACLLVLTASGGPFLHSTAEQIESASIAAALNHPTWKMGNRITIDSATLMNKGFEVIEAHWLFGFTPDQIRVKVHPQSTVHSLVEFIDGSVIAQLSVTDMQVPIKYALTYPERMASNSHGFDWAGLARLDFMEPDTARFPCLRLAYEAMRAGQSATCALNAADEIAVAAFLEGRIPFGAISRVIGAVLDELPVRRLTSVDEVLDHDAECRRLATRRLAKEMLTTRG
ncbi:MAG: 1-deoxy-D-xylulose-5-phosphate reductoisomerase [Acidobacteria bacterium]|nr:1-deoxy-D-xylulose-5-phosphate reductoisomerase [Acidobacteriota bacterium]